MPKASTEGAAPETISEPAGDAAKPTQELTPPLASAAPLAPPTVAIMLPSEHIDYAVLLENDLHNRIHAIQSGIAALEGELAGKQVRHEADIAEMQAAHDTMKTSLIARIDNLKTALRMAKSGVAARDIPQ